MKKAAVLAAVMVSGWAWGISYSAFDYDAAHRWGNAGGGTWGELGNWSVGGEAAGALPGEEDTAYFTAEGSPAEVVEVQVGADAAVKNLVVGNAGGPHVRLDMGGNTLEVKGTAAVGGWSCQPVLEVTNGTFKVDGDLAYMLKNGYQDLLGAYFRASGPETVVKVGKLGWEQRPWQPNEVSRASLREESSIPIRIGGGAQFETTGTSRSFDIAVRNENGIVAPATYIIEGAGTKAILRGGWLSRNNTRGIVRDGAVVEVTGTADTASRTVFVGWYSSNALLLIDDAKFSSSNKTVLVGQTDASKAYNNAICVTNNGVFEIHSGDLEIGRSGKSDDSPSYCISGTKLQVLDGARLMCSNSIIMGAFGRVINGLTEVENATVDCGKFTIGGAYNGLSTNNWLEVRGTNPVVRARNAGDGLQVSHGGGVRFRIGPKGYCGTPVRVEAGKVAVRVAENKEWVLMPHLEVVDEGFAKANAKAEVVLIECGVECREALTMLATNLTLSVERPEIYGGEVKVSEDGKRLTYCTPPRRGTVVVVR